MSTRRNPPLRAQLLAASCALSAAVLASPARADRTAPGAAEVAAEDAWAFKLTPSYYASTQQRAASDVNLRANRGAHAFWLGNYRRAGEFEQTRAGYEYTAQYSFVQLVPSVQLAAHGFAGGSLNAQIGDAVHVLLGVGRTNTRDYYNLNFDPNDSLVVGVGTRLLPRSTLALYTVRDDRLHTGQTVTHLLWRLSPGDQQRWTVDLASKHGRPSADEDAVAGLSLALGYDWHDVFVRVARDRKVNFSNDDQTRVSVGLRF